MTTNSALGAALLIWLGSACAGSPGEPDRVAEGPNPLNNVYFGEQHLHASASPDAFAFGTRNDANDAYRFAKGEAIKNAQSGEMIQKKTPYDWAAVTDHAEYLGVMPLLLDPNSPLQKTEIGKLISKGDRESGEAAFQQIITSATINKPVDYLVDPKIMKPAWQKQVDAANKLYDVVWSDDRMLDDNGKLRPVGNTVDVEKATYTNDIGDTQLSAVWTDPDFDPSQHAVYYVRVIEIPTPRWSTYDAAQLGVEPPKDVAATIQERAWASPIWYTPDPSLVKKLDFYPGLQEKLPQAGFHIGTLEKDQ